MNAHIVYCHPSKTSCTHAVCESFIRGVLDSGNTCTVSDLYALDFDGDITEAEYLRDANYRDTGECPPEIRAEQDRINNSDALVFVYPVFWTEAPAKLKGWFDRVWSFGFAYGANRRMKTIPTSLVMCCAGHSIETLEQFGYLESMKKVMLNDRLNDRAQRREFVVYDETSHEKITAEKRAQYVEDAYSRGSKLFSAVQHADAPAAMSLDGIYCTGRTAPAGFPISELTVFSFRQKDETVWAEYQGGGIEKGMLLGSLTGASLKGTWQHRTTDGDLYTGTFSIAMSRDPSGRLLLDGSWIGTAGKSPSHIVLFEEVSEV
ncbi:MAG TPA: NAD(P)H-dependent oxidoreductase [Treponemataceae bacterium]|nr:NAD(P)H-dependent oxidoreductase [Treponemataceae bacterium]